MSDKVLRPVLVPYDRTSLSGKAVSRHFKVKRPFADGRFRPKKSDVIINWGINDEIPIIKEDTLVLNKPKDVSLAASKLDCLTILGKNGINVPYFATNLEDAKSLFGITEKVFCRTLTRASKGKGIVIAKNEKELVDCTLYTAMLDVDIEYRVHVFNGEVIDLAQKKRMSTERRKDKKIEVRNEEVRNLMNGWSFTRTDITLKDAGGVFYHEIIKIALEGAKALNLDFCAIDLIKDKNDVFYILEVNTAPGMKKGTTTHRRYVRAISRYCAIPFSDESYTERYGIPNDHKGNLNNFINTYLNSIKDE